jgi:RHS repeat-associated protein
MGTVRYTVIDGEIVSEVRDGVRRDYVPDSLGNTIALTDGTTFTDTWEYWPYGEVRTRTGTNPTPFQFGGVLGYYTDSANSRIYVRARTYRQGLGRWQTVDPLAVHPVLWRLLSWPGRRRETGYAYADTAPQQYRDPSGLFTLKICFSPVPPFFPIPCTPVPGSPPGFTISTDPDKDIIDYNYGIYCGAKVGCADPVPGMDCIDKACREHDQCTSPLKGSDYFVGRAAKRCHCQLAARALLCANGGCLLDHADGLPGSINCNSAAFQVFLVFQLQCDLTWPLL